MDGAAAITLEELPIPASLDAPGGDAFIEMVGVRNRVQEAALGSDALAMAPSELLPEHRSQDYERSVVVVARLGGQIVGRGVWWWSAGEDASVSWIEVEVLPERRTRGIGSALLSDLERRARELGHVTVQSEAIHTVALGGPRITPPTGAGAVPARDPGARFLTARGYRLEQVARVAVLDLPVDTGVLAAARARAQSAAVGYRLVAWEGGTPERWRSDVAGLRQRMALDEPTGGLDIDHEHWDESRVVSHDRTQAASGRTKLTVAAEHTASAALVGFSELVLAPDPSRPAFQEDTLVLPEHRGHRLGMLLKVANLERLAEVSPAPSAVLTFNAEENRPMIAINEALGFRTIGFEGAWKKDLT